MNLKGNTIILLTTLLVIFFSDVTTATFGSERSAGRIRSLENLRKNAVHKKQETLKKIADCKEFLFASPLCLLMYG